MRAAKCVVTLGVSDRALQHCRIHLRTHYWFHPGGYVRVTIGINQ
jgi:hypothetical protein